MVCLMVGFILMYILMYMVNIMTRGIVEIDIEGRDKLNAVCLGREIMEKVCVSDYSKIQSISLDDKDNRYKRKVLVKDKGEGKEIEVVVGYPGGEVSIKCERYYNDKYE